MNVFGIEADGVQQADRLRQYDLSNAVARHRYY